MRLALALVVALLVTGCGNASSTTAGAPPTDSTKSAPVKAPPAKPKHRVTYSSSCNRASVVFQTSPPKLVSEVVLHNTGSAVTYVRAETRWLYFGGGSTNEVVTPIRLGAGETKRVGISKIVDLATIEKMIGWKYGDKMCRTTVAMWNH